MGQLLTLQQVSERLQVTELTVWRWIRAGKLAARKAGRQWRIREEDVEAFLGQPSNVQMVEAEKN